MINKMIGLLIMVICLIYVPSVLSQLPLDSVKGQADNELQQQIQSEIAYLQAEMGVFTEIATKTRMEADLVPGMVTILTGKDLERKGVRIVGEALAFVPGFSLGGSRDTAPLMRGVQMTSAYKIKGLLNGVPLNASLTGELSPLFFIPIEQVERIEVIRGPGSAVYGKWAYLGVINVITYQQGNRISARYGSHKHAQGGLLASYSNPEDTIQASLNIGGYQRERSGVESGPDLISAIGMPSNAPGPVNDASKAPHGVLSFDYHDFYLLGQWTEVNFGSGFGLTEALPPVDDRTNIGERHWSIEAGWERELTNSLRFKFLAGWKEYRWDSGDIWLYPAGFLTPEEDAMGRSFYKDRAIETVLNVHWQPADSHQLLVTLEYEYLTMQDDDIWMKVNYDPILYYPVPYQQFKDDKNWLETGKSRHIYSVTLQDQIEIHHRFNLTAGMRYDHYKDNDNNFSRLTPRLAGVFQATPNHTLKLQYAEAFRPPGFMEMYAINNPVYSGNSTLKAETVKTYEAGYIYRHQSFIGRLTAFHARMEGLITVKDKQYINADNANMTGAEAEAEFKILSWFDIKANISYTDTENQDGSNMQGAARWMSSASLLFFPQPDWIAGVTYRYMGDRFRDAADNRPKLDEYHNINLTLSKDNLLIKGLTLRTGIKNVFDEDIRFPAPPVFPDDYPKPGREFWGQISYCF